MLLLLYCFFFNFFLSISSLSFPSISTKLGPFLVLLRLLRGRCHGYVAMAYRHGNDISGLPGGVDSTEDSEYGHQYQHRWVESKIKSSLFSAILVSAHYNRHIYVYIYRRLHADTADLGKQTFYTIILWTNSQAFTVLVITHCSLFRIILLHFIQFLTV